MRQVWKLPVAPMHGWQSTMAPAGAQPVHLGEDSSGNLSVWVLVDSDRPNRDVLYSVVGTGWALATGARHVHTCVTRDGFAWHLFVPAEDTP